MNTFGLTSTIISNPFFEAYSFILLKVFLIFSLSSSAERRHEKILLKPASCASSIYFNILSLVDFSG